MYTPQALKKIDIFISSPSDVKAEREAIKRVIELLNRMLYIPMGILLYPLTYEELVPPAMGKPAQLIVDRYMQEPDKCYLLICILWRRMGTPFTHPTTGEYYLSGTEYEFIKAYKANEIQNTPQILLYRRVSDDTKTAPDGEQVKRVTEFFDKVMGDKAVFKGLFQPYKTLREFEKTAQIHIADVLREHPPSEKAETITRPQMIEEDRRLDIALPQAAQLNKPTELWVQLCVKNSFGFRDKLPKDGTSIQELSQEGISEYPLGVVFPVNAETQRLESVVLSVELVAPDFEVSTLQLTLSVTHGKDTVRLAFSLVPRVINTRSIVLVYVKQMMPEGNEIIIETVVLYTKIIAETVMGSKWAFLQRPLMGSKWAFLQRPLKGLMTFKVMLEAKLKRDQQEHFGDSVRADLGLRFLDGDLLSELKLLDNNSRVYMLIEALNDKDEHVRAAAAEVLGQVQFRDNRAVEPLIAALHDKHNDVRVYAAAALRKIGDNRAVEPLIAALHDKHNDVRATAAIALGEFRDIRAVEPLMAALNHKHPDGRRMIERLSRHVGDSRAEAAIALGEIGDTRAVESLITALNDKNPEVRRSAAWGLSQFGDIRAVEPLIAALNDKEGGVRWHAEKALEKIGTPEALEAVRRYQEEKKK